MGKKLIILGADFSLVAYSSNDKVVRLTASDIYKTNYYIDTESGATAYAEAAMDGFAITNGISCDGYTSVIINTGFKYTGAFFSGTTDDTFVKSIYAGSDFSTNTTFAVPTGAKYMKINLRSDNVTNIIIQLIK